MSRRAPPRDYYEEDEVEFERERERDRYPRPRRDHEYEEDDVQYRRRRSMPPVEDLERMHIRERPPRDFLRESFAPPRDRGPMVMRRSRGEDDEVLPEPEREEIYMRPPRERRRHRPREVDEEELVVDERERHSGRRRRSERDIEEDDMTVRRRERPPPRDYESEGEFRSREKFEDERDEIYARRSEPRRRPRRREEDIEELIVDGRDRDPPRPRKSREEPRLDRREEMEELIIDDSERERPRSRKLRGGPKYDQREEMEELVIDDRERERPRHRKFREEPRHKEEVVMRWKDRPSPGEVDEEEIRFRETRHRKRRSPSDLRPAREPPGSWPTDKEEDGTDEEIRIRSRTRSRPRRRGDEEDEEIIIRRDERERDHHRRAEVDEALLLQRDERERDRRRATEDDKELIIRHDGRDRRGRSSEDEEIFLRKSKQRSPPRERSPSMEPIRAPPIHQDVITHHRHIDHGYDRPPRAPSPDVSSTRTSFDEVDVHHRNKKGNRHEDESVFTTSGRSLDFNDPWEADRVSSRRKPKSLGDDRESLIEESSRSRLRRKLPRELDLDDEDEEEEVLVHEERSGPRSSARSLIDKFTDKADEWSVVHAPSKEDAVEMTGALNVVEVAPKDASDKELDRKRIGAQVVKERRDERWTEIAKDLVVREAIERLGYEFEETRTFYYVFSYLEPGDIDEIVGLSDEIREARRRRIREMHRERASLPPRPSPLMDRIPPRARMAAERRMREREWIIDPRR